MCRLSDVSYRRLLESFSSLNRSIVDAATGIGRKARTSGRGADCALSWRTYAGIYRVDVPFGEGGEAEACFKTEALETRRDRKPFYRSVPLVGDEGHEANRGEHALLEALRLHAPDAKQSLGGAGSGYGHHETTADHELIS